MPITAKIGVCVQSSTSKIWNYPSIPVHYRLWKLPIYQLLLSWVTASASHYWFWWNILRGIIGLLVTRGHHILVWISQDPYMGGLYEMFLVSIIQCTEVSNIRTGIKMGLWKHIFFHLGSQKFLLWIKMNFSQWCSKHFLGYLTHPCTLSCKSQTQVNYKHRV